MATTTGGRPDAVLQKYSLELLACIEEMRHKRDVLHKQILNETKEKEKIQHDLRMLAERLTMVNESICDHVIVRNRLDDTIHETEDAFKGLVDGSQNLANFVKKVSAKILPEITEKDPPKEQQKKKNKQTLGLQQR